MYQLYSVVPTKRWKFGLEIQRLEKSQHHIFIFGVALSLRKRYHLSNMYIWIEIAWAGLLRTYRFNVPSFRYSTNQTTWILSDRKFSFLGEKHYIIHFRRRTFGYPNNLNKSANISSDHHNSTHIFTHHARIYVCAIKLDVIDVRHNLNHETKRAHTHGQYWITLIEHAQLKVNHAPLSWNNACKTVNLQNWRRERNVCLGVCFYGILCEDRIHA